MVTKEKKYKKDINALLSGNNEILVLLEQL